MARNVPRLTPAGNTVLREVLLCRPPFGKGFAEAGAIGLTYPLSSRDGRSVSFRSGARYNGSARLGRLPRIARMTTSVTSPVVCILV